MGTWLCRCATARPPTRSLHGGGARNARHGVGGLVARRAAATAPARDRGADARAARRHLVAVRRLGPLVPLAPVGSAVVPLPAAAGDRDQGRGPAGAARLPAARAAAPCPAGRPGLPLRRPAPAALRRPRAGTGPVVPGQSDHRGGRRAAGRGLSALVGAVPLVRAEHGGRDLGGHALVRGRAGLRLASRRTAARLVVALPRPAAASAGRAALADPAAARGAGRPVRGAA